MTEKKSGSISIALGGLAAIATLLLFIGVNPAEWFKHEPLNVSIVGVVNQKIDRKNIPYRIYDTNDDHNTFDTNTKHYRHEFKAEPGYLIKSTKWVEESATRQSDFNIVINEGGLSVIVTFGLKAGPKTDRYRGWLKGNLETLQERIVPRIEKRIATGIDVEQEKSFVSVDELSKYEVINVFGESGNLLGSINMLEKSVFKQLEKELILLHEDDSYFLVSKCM